MAKSIVNKKCSFCGKAHDKHDIRLIAGAAGQICNECVARCSDILSGKSSATETRESKRGESAPPVNLVEFENE
jgi:ATP-dependent protease Clp ATPase subunit